MDTGSSGNALDDAVFSISVVVPVYNGAAYLAEALESIVRQSWRPTEVIVVDDGSGDDSAALAEAFAGVTVLRRPHAGLGATLNAGVAAATGRYLAFLDADDRWLPGKLALQVAAMRQDPSLDLVFGGARQFFTRPGPGAPGEQALAQQAGVCKSSLFISRAAFWRAGPFAEDPGLHDFLDWYARATEAGLRQRVLPELVYERRIHDQNTGVTLRSDQRQRYLRTLRGALARRRPGGGTASPGPVPITPLQAGSGAS